MFFEMKKIGKYSLVLLAGVNTHSVSATETNLVGFMNTIGSITDSEAPYLGAEIDDSSSFQGSTFGLVLSGDREKV